MADKPRVRNKRRLKQIIFQLEAQGTILADVAQDYTDMRYARYSAGFEVVFTQLSQVNQVLKQLEAII